MKILKNKTDDNLSIHEKEIEKNYDIVTKYN